MYFFCKHNNSEIITNHKLNTSNTSSTTPSIYLDITVGTAHPTHVSRPHIGTHRPCATTAAATVAIYQDTTVRTPPPSCHNMWTVLTVRTPLKMFSAPPHPLLLTPPFAANHDKEHETTILAMPGNPYFVVMATLVNCCPHIWPNAVRGLMQAVKGQ